MDLSICIVNWNTWLPLKACLFSIEQGIVGISHETIVVDNASRDRSAERVRSHFPKVHLIANPENRGFAAASNQAIRMAEGRYILLLNPDTLIHHDALDTMVHFMDEHPEAGAIGCKLLNEDGSVQDSVRRFLTFGMALQTSTFLGKIPLLGKMGDYKMRGFLFSKVEEVDAAGGAALMVRRSVLEEVGLLDETYFIFMEDMDLCRRIWSVGYKVYYVPDASITHLGGESRYQSPNEILLIAMNSMMRYFTKFEGAKKTFFFKMLYKPLFILRLLYEMMIDFFNMLEYGAIRRNPSKLKKKAMKIRGNFHFLTRDLGHFIFKL